MGTKPFHTDPAADGGEQEQPSASPTHNGPRLILNDLLLLADILPQLQAMRQQQNHQPRIREWTPNLRGWGDMRARPLERVAAADAELIGPGPDMFPLIIGSMYAEAEALIATMALQRALLNTLIPSVRLQNDDDSPSPRPAHGNDGLVTVRIRDPEMVSLRPTTAEPPERTRRLWGEINAERTAAGRQAPAAPSEPARSHQASSNPSDGNATSGVRPQRTRRV